MKAFIIIDPDGEITDVFVGNSDAWLARGVRMTPERLAELYRRVAAIDHILVVADCAHITELADQVAALERESES